MEDINLILREEFIKLNKKLRQRHEILSKIDRDELRRRLGKIGSFYKLEKMSGAELKQMNELIAVDGSVNRIGGLHPHYIEMYTALGLSADKNREPFYVTRIYSPFENDILSEQDESSEKLLAGIELEAASGILKKAACPCTVMMDGGLIRYKIEAPEALEELLNEANKLRATVFGLIKDPKTGIVSESVGMPCESFDREILFGALNEGEILIIDDDVNKKHRDGISSAFMRLSKLPMAVGIDIPSFDRDRIIDAARLSYTLTPKSSRGVPIFLDITDSKVKLSDNQIKAMASQFIDRDIYERFFISERERRVGY